MFSVIIILAPAEEVAKFLVAANELGMMNGEYAFVTLDFTIYNLWLNKPWAGNRSREDFIALFDGIINLSVKEPHGERYATFVQQFGQKLKANNVSEISPVSILMNYY